MASHRLLLLLVLVGTCLSVAVMALGDAWEMGARIGDISCPYDIILYSSGTWARAFVEPESPEDAVRVAQSRINYFPVSTAAIDPSFSVPEHVTIITTFENTTEFEIVSITYQISLIDRFGSSLHEQNSIVDSRGIPSHGEYQDILHIDASPSLVDLMEEASDGRLRVRVRVTKATFPGGFFVPRVWPCPSWSPPSSDGIRACTEVGSAVLLFPDATWRYDAAPTSLGGAFLALKSATVTYHSVDRSSADPTYVVPHHVYVTIVLQNIDEREIGGFIAGVCLGAPWPNPHGNQAWTGAMTMRETIPAQGDVEVRFEIINPSTDLVLAIQTGRVGCCVALGSILLDGEDELLGNRSFFDQAVLAEVHDCSRGIDIEEDLYCAGIAGDLIP